MARRRGVEDDQAVGIRSLELFDLAQDEDLANSRDRGGDDLQDTGGHQALGHPAQPVVRQVFDERVVRGDDAPSNMPATSGFVEHRLGVVEDRVVTEQGVKAARVVELDDEDFQPEVSSHPGQGRSDGRLADTALAGDDDHVALPAKGLAIHSGRHYLPSQRRLFAELSTRTPCKRS